MSYKYDLQSNNTDLQQILDKVSTLPTLPTISNPASADNIEAGYEAVDGNGNKITGTFSGKKLVGTVNFTYEERMNSGVGNYWVTYSEYGLNNLVQEGDFVMKTDGTYGGFCKNNKFCLYNCSNGYAYTNGTYYIYR